ncbi:biotin carboxyl carrier protein of acetyl-CoA carboxylase 1, chloroplastic-like [Iris pallida]|uniref:Biotin carboxyl carrier protein of acetyl-CoA carboxylase n=1 Tax=Iris pallida TaxID=29817 RepID=A0AAX6F2U3_IRIPA|nr:biotin carboxyl carrier protein of acetyl-CoA carboxylase 1, chloroplastic-like [Iris pallida]KAJ6846785.1 biotin carboxyl carrier protein of acetyl-CoA carboxylase 1, chloroplastic-like [Iris pallida]
MASISIPCPKVSSSPPVSSRNHQPVPTRRLSVASLQGPKQRRFPVLKAQAREAALENSFNSSPVAASKSKTEHSNGAVAEAEESTSQSVVPESVITAFMAEVSDLVKLVDSRDIIELQLKQKDCELIIRKKEALQPAPSAPVVMMAPPQAMYSPPPPPPLPSAVPPLTPAAPSPAAPAAALPAPAKGSKSSHPPLKCPMAGTFYRSPAPGEPAFVKVGDKVKKGQVVCIIEAMKLMNEIEADQSGTVVDILAEDGKPVSVDMPLLVIEP